MIDWAHWVRAFLLTQAVEVPILTGWLSAGERPVARPLRERVALAFGASAITHPILWLVWRPLLAPVSFEAYVVVGETFAVLAEALYLKRLGVKDALLASVTANGASWLVGRLLWTALPLSLALGAAGSPHDLPNIAFVRNIGSANENDINLLPAPDLSIAIPRATTSA